MFTYIKLKNYKSLVDFHADFTDKKDTPKKLILIYGENGSGKSNLATSFYTLEEMLRTRSVKEILQKIRDKKADNNKNNIDFQEAMHRVFFLKNIEDIIEDSKTNNSTENMLLEFGFKIKGKSGVYRVETDDKQIVSEYLEFALNKNKTVLFEITEKKADLNEKLFKNAEYKKEIKTIIEQYWGKHSLLSLILYELEDKNQSYVKSCFDKAIFEVLDFLHGISIKVDFEHGSLGKVSDAKVPFQEATFGSVISSKAKEIEKMENVLNLFFTHLYPDIKQVYYKKTIDNDKINYTLYFKKQIYGKLVDVSFDQESSGTRNLINLVPFILNATNKKTVVIDEIDNGIHDMLFYRLMENIKEYLSGQLIITTHNTLLLEADFANKNAYIINIDKNGNKKLILLSDFERLHPNLNVRKRYLQGFYGGIPVSMDVDFNELAECLK